MVAMIEYGEPLYWYIGMTIVFVFGILLGIMFATPEKAQKNND